MAATSAAETFEKLERLLGPKGFTREAADLAPWLVDWRGRYRGAAAALLSPATTLEVSHIVTACAAARVPIVPQGGNSSMSGGATPDAAGNAVLLSLRRMNRLRSLDPEQGYVVAEAGVILAHLHEAAAAQGQRFPLTLGARGAATIGGLVSTNAGGTQVLRWGTMRSLVLGLEAVLPSGAIYDGLAPLKKDNRGYSLTQLLIGAEGTLGIVTAASLRLAPSAPGRAVAWVGVSSPAAALDLLRRAEAQAGDAIESFELVPAAALALVLEHVPGTRRPIATAAPWHVLIEAIGAPDAVAASLAGLLESAGPLVLDAAIAASEAQADAFWRLRDSISEAEARDGPAAKHDLSVPVASMPAFIVDASAAVERHFAGASVIVFGHLGDGNVHFNVRAPQGAGAGWIETEAPQVTAFVHDLVCAAGGSISAEHGIGQMRLAELARLTDSARLEALRAIKQALDPLGIMNPGKLVPPAPGHPSLAKSASGS